jgi:hypothetical protein
MFGRLAPTGRFYLASLEEQIKVMELSNLSSMTGRFRGPHLAHHKRQLPRKGAGAIKVCLLSVT